MKLESLHGLLRAEFEQFCKQHKYHPTTATVKADKCKETSTHYTITIDMHLNQRDYRAHATHEDHHVAMKTAFHSLQNNIAHHTK